MARIIKPQKRAAATLRPSVEKSGFCSKHVGAKPAKPNDSRPAAVSAVIGDLPMRAVDRVGRLIFHAVIDHFVLTMTSMEDTESTIFAFPCEPKNLHARARIGRNP